MPTGSQVSEQERSHALGLVQNIIAAVKISLTVNFSDEEFTVSIYHTCFLCEGIEFPGAYSCESLELDSWLKVE
jgi:hypothetical protein